MEKTSPIARWELRFVSLFDAGRAWGFPCDAQGRVDLDALSERARANYLYARAVFGRGLTLPPVHACPVQRGVPLSSCARRPRRHTRLRPCFSKTEQRSCTRLRTSFSP